MSTGLLGLALLLPGGDLSPAQIFRDAEAAVSGRPAEARAAADRLEMLEERVLEKWHRRPDGPREELAALALFHAAAGEFRLRPFLGEAPLAQLRALRGRCHAEAAATSGGPPEAEPFLRALAADRKCILRALMPSRGLSTAILYAVCLPDPPTEFDPAEPPVTTGGSSHFHDDGRVSIRLSDDLCRTTPAGRLSVLLFEAFNAQDAAINRQIFDAAAAGTITREDYVRLTVAAEQLAFAHMLWALRRNFDEAKAVGLADDPAPWNVAGIRSFHQPDAGLYYRTRGYPNDVYGWRYDMLRFETVSRSGRTDPADETCPWNRPAPGPDVWECFVLVDRLRFFAPEEHIPDSWAVRADAVLSERCAGEFWFRLHHALPTPARRWLASVRGGASAARWAEAAAAALL